MTAMKKTTGLIASAFALFFISYGFVAAQSSIQQKIDVTISPDFSATGVWTLPVKPADGPWEFDDLQNFGSTGIMNFRLKKIANDDGVLPTQPYGYGVSVQYPVTGSGLQDTTSLRNLYVSYDIESELTSPAPLYEIWIAGGAHFNQPALTIHFPVGWQLVSSWPAGTQKGQTLTINYPTDTSYVSPALLLFLSASLPTGQQVAHSGRYTVIGSTRDVQKILDALNHFDFVDDLFKNVGGFGTLDSVVIYSGDLSKAKIGYEAAALAAKPNLILYNKDTLANQTRQQIETVLVHEMTHLAEIKLGLFHGATYIAPWFKEGLAVFMENQARPYIYTDAAGQALDDLTGETHMFNRTALKQRESMSFDYLFDGLPMAPVWDSYSLSGAVVANFFKKAAVTGMKKLYTALKDKNSSQIAQLNDSEAILNAMQTITGLTRDETLFPYKSSSNFDTDVAFLVYPQGNQATNDAVVDFIQNKIPKYFKNDNGFVATTTTGVDASIPNPQSTPPVTRSKTSCVKIARTLSVGMRGDDVRTLQEFLIVNGYIAKGLNSGYYGTLTLKAVRAWQTASGISSVGTVGPKSRAALATGCN